MRQIPFDLDMCDDVRIDRAGRQSVYQSSIIPTGRSWNTVRAMTVLGDVLLPQAYEKGSGRLFPDFAVADPP